MPVVKPLPLGSWAAASSSRVKVRLAASWLPPASDITIAFRPVGLTSRMSRSSGFGWLSPLITRLTSVMVLVSPEIAQVEG